jgi:hypothetical protein
MRAVLTLLAVSAIFALGPAAARPGPGLSEIRLISIRTSNHPEAKKEGSWTSSLLNAVPQFGRPVGTKVGGEVGFSHGAQLVGAIKLPGGVLAYSGKPKRLPHDGGIVVPVIDGSGTFSGVSGTYTLVRDGKTTARAVLVLRLQYGTEGSDSSHGHSHH